MPPAADAPADAASPWLELRQVHLRRGGSQVFAGLSLHLAESRIGLIGHNGAGVGLGLNLPLGPLMATVGGKGVYTNPNYGDEGYAAAVGGGLQWKIGNSFRLFGEYYYSPDSLSSGIQSYEEANAGARYTIMRPVSIEAGYRYLNLSGKDGNRDNAVADGPYVGVNASF